LTVLGLIYPILNNTFQQDVEKLTAENMGLKEEANKAQNEVVDLRSEVMKLRYSSIVSSAEEEKRLAKRRNVELKLEVNMLQHENEDLKKLVGSLKYGSHPGNSEGGCPNQVSGK
jgi:dynactin complex subunit